MNVFKPIFLGLLALSLTPIRGMEKPTTTATISKKITNTVAPEDQCPCCLETVQNTPENQRQITVCCDNFICQTDANKIYNNAQSNASNYQTPQQQANFIAHRGFAPKNSLKALCPLCRKELQTRSATIRVENEQQQSITIIDIEGKEFILEGSLAQALCTCTALEAFKSHPGVLDFSNINLEEKNFLKKDMITQLAKFIADPISEREKLFPVLEFFEVAHYLGAPDNILYILANELWPCMQDHEKDAQAKKNYKKYLRSLARPYLSNPRYLLRYLKSKPEQLVNAFRTSLIKEYEQQLYKTLDISFDSLRTYLEAMHDHGWYTHNNDNWYMVYPFCTLDGIIELFEYLRIDDRQLSLSLRGHKLETFSCDLLERIETLDVSSNNIQKLIGDQFKYKEHIPLHIILDQNPISSVDESFFDALRKARVRNYWRCSISLPHNNLSNAQKADVTKKFYKATNTIPDRYLNQSIFEQTFKRSGALVGGISSALATYYLSHKIPNTMRAISMASCITLGAAVGSLREIMGHGSAPWLLGDMITGGAASYFGANKLFNKFSWLTKAIPMALAALPGGFVGMLAGSQVSRITANCIAKLSHPQISWRDHDNKAWRGGTYTIEL